MEPLVYVMAILGCGESEAPCRELALVERRYASEAACLADTERELVSRDDLPYPSIVAQCRRDGAGVRLLRGDEVLLPEPAPGRSGRLREASAREQAGR